MLTIDTGTEKSVHFCKDYSNIFDLMCENFCPFFRRQKKKRTFAKINTVVSGACSPTKLFNSERHHTKLKKI